MDNPIRRSAAPISGPELDGLEVVLGLTLPADYRGFLLAHNGGVPQRNRFTHAHKPGQSRETWLKWIYSVGREGLLDPRAEDVLSAYRDRPVGLPAGLLPAGSAYFLGNFGFVCVACGGADAGKVFFRPLVEPEKPTVYPVAESWTAFIAGLDHEYGRAQAWKVAFEGGDLPSLREWLVENGQWRKDRGHALQILRAAVEMDDWPAVETLLDLGFDPDDLFNDALISHRPELVHRIVRSGKVPAKAVKTSLARASLDLWQRPTLLAELVAAGAEVDAQDHSDRTPLHRAVEAQSEAGIRFLLQHGADPTIEDDEGRTPHDLAETLEEPALAALLHKAEEARADAQPADDGPEVVAFDLCGVTIGKPGPPLTLDDIKAFEATLGFTLPPEYRFLLLRANGGVPTPNRLPLAVDHECAEEEDGDDRDEEYPFEREPAVGEFFRLRTVDRAPEMRRRADVFIVEEMRDWLGDRGELPRNTVAIGSLEGYGYEGTGFLVLGCKGENRGKLFAFEDEPLNLTLTELFAAMGSGGPRPAQATADAGDAPRGGDERSIPGSTPRDLGAMLGQLQGLLQDEDGPPSPDQGTRLGATIAEATAALDRQMQAFAGTIEAMKAALASVAQATGSPAADPGRAAANAGDPPADKALHDAWFRHGDLYHDVEKVRALLARGADPNQRYAGGLLMPIPKGATPLHVAAAAGSPAGARLLLEAGADPDALDDLGNSPLHRVAPTEGGIEVGRMLLERGARTGVWNDRDEMALHHAIRIGSLDLAFRLIDAGEDLHAKPQKSITLSGGYVHTFAAASAAEVAERTVETRALLRELEAHAARRKAAQDRPGD